MTELIQAGMLLVLLGIGMAFLGMILLFLGGIRRSEGHVETKGAGVFLIGPIPIIFGSDVKWTAVLAAIALVILVISLLSYLR